MCRVPAPTVIAGLRGFCIRAHSRSGAYEHSEVLNIAPHFPEVNMVLAETREL